MATDRSGTDRSARSGDLRGERPSDATPRAVWLLIGTIGAAKAITLGVIVWASGSGRTALLVAATLPPWLFAAAALLVGPLLFRLRLRRVRARRDRLRRAEWMLPPARPRRARPLLPRHPRSRDVPTVRLP